MGQNPAVGGQNASFQRQALAKLDWLVVRDLYETETASFWKDSPGGQERRAEDRGHPDRGLLPAGRRGAGDGRQLHQHAAAGAVARQGRRSAGRRPHRHLVHRTPGPRLKELYAGSTSARDQGVLSLTWDYIDADENADWRIKDEPSAERILKEINGYTWNDKKLLGQLHATQGRRHNGVRRLDLYRHLCANPTAPGGLNHAANRTPDDWVAPGWGFAWPANRRIMYNRAAADPAGNPWPKEARLAQQYSGGKFKGYVYFDPQAEAGKDAQGNPLLGRWVGLDVPDFPLTKTPTAPAKPNGVGLDFHDGASPFIMKSDGKGWLFAPSGLVDGPLPTHYEPYESPVQNPVYKQQTNPAGHGLGAEGNAGRGRLDRVSARSLDLSADRASPQWQHEPLAALAGRVAAGAVLRDQSGARRGTGDSATPSWSRSARHAARSRPRPWSPSGSGRI